MERWRAPSCPLPHPVVEGPDKSLWAPNLLFPWRRGMGEGSSAKGSQELDGLGAPSQSRVGARSWPET